MVPAASVVEFPAIFSESCVPEGGDRDSEGIMFFYRGLLLYIYISDDS